MVTGERLSYLLEISTTNDKDYILEDTENIFPNEEVMLENENVVEMGTVEIPSISRESSTNIDNDYMPEYIENSSDSVSSIDAETQKTNLSRKRQRNEKNWKQNQIKKNKNEGKSYINSKGRTITEKKIGPACEGKCKYNCSRKITEDQRNKLFQMYWELGDVTKQIMQIK